MVKTIIAAVDSSNTSKKQADCICTGINDENTFKKAADELPQGGIIKLCTGNYNTKKELNINDRNSL